jgi:hypothetical protein
LLKIKLLALIVVAAALLPGCSGNETNEETKYVTQMVTVEETVSSKTTEEPSASEEREPEDVLALQYEYINSGNFEEAYSLFAEQSRQEVSLTQYRAFFEANAPYSVTDYSFSPAQVQGDSASVDVEFTATSASGEERLQRTQEFVRENGDWRVVMRPKQVAVFTATDNVAEKESMPALPGKVGSSSEEESQPEEEGRSSAGITLSGSGQTATEPFELEYGLAVFRMAHQGNRNFIVWLLDSNGRRVDLLVNEIGSSSGSKAVQIPRDGTYLLQVEADGPWTVQVD